MTRLVVGTYAGKGGAGLVPLSHDARADRWTTGDPRPAIRNASFGVIGRHIYLVDEQGGTIGVYDRDWREVMRVDSGGDAPCHLALAADEGALAVANYGSGSVSRFPLDADGLPGRPTTWRNAGRGPEPDRQEGPHAHWVGFDDEGALITVDLGADRVLRRSAEPPLTLYAAPPGSGPRHLAFHPRRPLAYLVSELAATLTVLERGGDMLHPRAIVPTAPAGAPADNLGGAIALNAEATHLYVTNRGHDSIATYRLEADGTPVLLGHMPSAGASPRFVMPLAGHLIVANEEGGSVAIFRLADDGQPAPDPLVLAIAGAAFVMRIA